MQRKVLRPKRTMDRGGRRPLLALPVDGWRKAFSAKIFFEDRKLWQLFLVPLLAGAEYAKGGVPNDLNSILWTPLPQSRDHPYRESSCQNHLRRSTGLPLASQSCTRWPTMSLKKSRRRNGLRLGAGWGRRERAAIPAGPLFRHTRTAREYHEQLRGMVFLPKSSD